MNTEAIEAPATGKRWPASPDEVNGGVILTLRERSRSLATRASELQHQLDQLEARRSACEATIRAASAAPVDADLEALAGAEAGVRLLDGAIREIKPRALQAGRAAQEAQANMQAAWAGYLAARERLERFHGSMTRGGWAGPLPDNGTADRAEVRRLTGW